MNLIEFYPTPEKLAEKMVDHLKIDEIETILEPSAGTGNLIKAYKNKHRKRHSYFEKDLDIDAIEIEQNLRAILKDEKVRVVHDNFLTYDTLKSYDLVLMNPPFSNGDEHLLKALRMQESGGKIVCLLNAETIRNPYSNKRQLLKKLLEDYEAEIEFLTEEFTSAERRTNVEVALIRVDIPQKEGVSILLDDLNRAKEEKEPIDLFESSSVISGDPISGMVEMYQEEAKLGVGVIKEFYRLSAISPDIKVDKSGGLLKLEIEGSNRKGPINRYLSELRKKHWKVIFDHPMFRNNLTSNLQSELQNRILELKDYEFSKFNIQQIFMETMGQLVKGVESTILDKFDYFSRHHMDDGSKNLHYFDGWKTNKSWKINKKIIIPMWGCIDGWRSDRISWGTVDTLQDIEKVFDYLDQGITDHPSNIRNLLNDCEGRGSFRNIDTKYFTLSFYKKGTAHVTFKDDDLLHKFNVFGSQRKGWLPPSYGKSSYQEMSQEEQSIIDEFEGEKSYNKTLANKDYFIVEPEKLLQLSVPTDEL